MVKLAYDLHLHSCLSPCGENEMTPSMIVGMAKIIGLDAIALTDHNSTLNCPAFMKAGEAYGIITIPGMELTTLEEVHVLCYFKKLEDAMAFGEYVHQHILPIKNTPEVFGSQKILDEEDNILGEEEILLISATDIPFSKVSELVRNFNGIMVPAHINKSTTSILSNLGFIPIDSDFKCAEVGNPKEVSSLIEQNPYLRGCNILTSSDAHSINDIQEPIRFLEAKSNRIEDIIASINKE